VIRSCATLLVGRWCQSSIPGVQSLAPALISVRRKGRSLRWQIILELAHEGSSVTDGPFSNIRGHASDLPNLSVVEIACIEFS